METEDLVVQDLQIREWRYKTLRDYGYGQDERRELMALLDAGELHWDQIRRLNDLGCPPEQARRILV